MFYAGNGVPRDFTAARQWWEKAFSGGEADAGYNLGILYSRGLDVARDPIQASAWWERAARRGSTMAQNAVGAAYERGEGVRPDPIKALAFYRLAAAGGLAVAVQNAALVASQLDPKAIAEAERLQADIAASASTP